MKANRPQAEKALKSPAGTPFFLFYGPDEASSRALARMLAGTLGVDAERIDLSGAELRTDPARLADEAAAISMFGGARWILVDPAGDETVPAVEALLATPAAANPVALVAGALKPASKLLKLALATPSAIACPSYAPDAGNASRLVAELARGQGLDVRADVARRIAEAAGGNRALIEQELAKFAAYLDAMPHAPKPLDMEAVEAIGAGAGEGDLSRLVESVASGNSVALEAELARLDAEGIEGITLIRAVLRRMLLLARLRSEVEGGRDLGDVIASAGKTLFWKEKDAVSAQVRRWRGELVARTVSRLVEAERLVKAPGGPGSVAVDEELFAICRQAARLR